MEEKLALPTPTMMMDMGSFEARTMAAFVAGMSLNTPSVSINSTKYCWRELRQSQQKYALNYELVPQVLKRIALFYPKHCEFNALMGLLKNLIKSSLKIELESRYNI